MVIITVTLSQKAFYDIKIVSQTVNMKLQSAVILCHEYFMNLH